METNQGWVCIWRKIEEKGWYKNSKYVHLWVHLLLKANHKQNEFMWNNEIIIIKEGQLITGRKQLSKETGIRESTLEDILKVFENQHQIQQQKTTKFRLITIINWKEYQQKEQQKQQQSNNRATTKQQQSDTNNNVNNDNNDNKEYATPKVVAEVKPFNLEEEVDKLVLGKVEHLQAIGLFIDINELKPTNSQQLSSIIKRNSRTACLLKGYSREQIIHTMSLLKKYADFKWTLESVTKYIDKPEDIKLLKK
jgi:hypothetical protein